jgi:hypothetical protein
VSRTTFSSHPWSIGGGGAADVLDKIEEQADGNLGSLVDAIGRTSVVGEDDCWILGHDVPKRYGFSEFCLRFGVGDCFRDWHALELPSVIYPYKSLGGHALDPLPMRVLLWLWPYRTLLAGRSVFGKSMADNGRFWYEHLEHYANKLRTPMSIPFAFVATHNHFVLDRGGKVFKQSAPIIKLPAEATEDDHLGLLGLLNSSTACFWMKQVFYPKATAVGDISTDKGRPEANRYEFASTGLLAFPVPSKELLATTQIISIARQLDDLVQHSNLILPGSILRAWNSDDNHALSDAIVSGEVQHEQIKQRMIALQEELDWEVYKAYGLTDEGSCMSVLSDTKNGILSEMRPFQWDTDTAPMQVPKSWVKTYERRRRILSTDTNITLIETLVFKRPWWGRQGVYGQASRTYNAWIADECREWLLDRLETPKFRKGTKDNPEFTTTAQMADVASADADFLQVAALYRGRPDFDVSALVAELVEGEAVPFLPTLRYKPAGLRKREVWERTWDLQRQQDAGKDVGEIPVPPKYVPPDFLKNDYWRLRGKLDVPKQRWNSYPHCSTESDPTLVVGWAGWNHLEQATALIAYYDARKREGWDAKRLTPLLAGLDQLLPWIHQWHPEIDAEFGETAGQSYQTMLEHDAHELGLTMEDIRNWTPPEKVKKTPKARKKKAEAEDDE